MYTGAIYFTFFIVIYLIGVIIAFLIIAISTYIDYYKDRNFLKEDIKVKDLFEESSWAMWSWIWVCCYISIKLILKPISSFIDKIGNTTIIHKINTKSF